MSSSLFVLQHLCTNIKISLPEITISRRILKKTLKFAKPTFHETIKTAADQWTTTEHSCYSYSNASTTIVETQWFRWYSFGFICKCELTKNGENARTHQTYLFFLRCSKENTQVEITCTDAPKIFFSEHHMVLYSTSSSKTRKLWAESSKTLRTRAARMSVRSPPRNHSKTCFSKLPQQESQQKHQYFVRGVVVSFRFATPLHEY